MNKTSSTGQATKTAVIGTGLMGSALARALARGGLPVTAWNRSRERAEPLREAGISVVDNLVEAIRQSDVIVVCISDFKAVSSLLRNDAVQAALSGRTIVNYTSGCAADVRDYANWATENGFHYIHGAIFVYPSDVGSADGDIAHAGDAAAYRQHEEVLRVLAGKARFIGEDAAFAALLERAMFAFYFGCTYAFYQGCAVLSTEGVNLDLFLSAAQKLMPVVDATLSSSLDMIRKDDFSGTDAHLDVLLASVEGAYVDAVASGVNSELLKVLTDITKRGISLAGDVKYELPIIYKAFLAPRS